MPPPLWFGHIWASASIWKFTPVTTRRGGSPTADDRILASRMGIAAIQALLEEQRSIMVGIQNDEIVYVPLVKAIKEKKDVKDDKWNAMRILSI